MMRRAIPTALLLLMLAVAGAVGVAALLPASSDHKDRLVLTGPTMGTSYRVVIRHEPGGAEPERWRRLIENRLERIERRMSSWRSDSTLSRFNRARTTDWFDVSAPLARVVRQGQRIAEASGGAFDMTVAPLVDLWGFGSDGRVEELPDEAAIRDALSRVGYGRLAVRMDPPALRKAKPSVAIDLSGIAKGYAADTVAEELQSLDSIRGCLVEIGGEIRVRGHGPHKEKWRLGIEAPTADRRSVRLRIALTDRALATSGDYRNFFEHDGVRYSHTLDPRTGHPVRHRLTSVSVVHHSAATADAWATALLVLGPEDGYELAERRGLAVCFMLRNGEEIEERMTALFRDLTLED